MNLGGVIHLNKTGLCVVCAVCLLLGLYTFAGDGATRSQRPKVNLRELLAVAIKAARAGGAAVVAARHDLKIESKGKTKEGANDSVTTADFRSHCVMKGTIARRFPSLTVISEEEKTVCDGDLELGGAEPQAPDNVDELWVDEKDITVWIDPLDATQEYTEQLYDYVTTMVCVAVNGAPTVGVVYRPFADELSWAWRDKGMSPNLGVEQDKEKEAPDDGTPKGVRVVISRSHSGKVRDAILRHFEDASIVEAGGAGYKVLEVVKGNADAYLHSTAIKKWDLCAGNAILDTVGGRMTTGDGRPIDYAATSGAVNERGVVATMKNHDDFVGKL